jgi:hypothetical protein
LLPGLLGHGRRNAFVFLLAYGAAHFRLETLVYEKDELAAAAAEAGAELHLEPYDELIEAAQLRIARVEEFHMVGMPDDFQLSGSLDLLDEYVSKLVEVGSELDLDARLVDPQFWRHLLLALITDYWPTHFEQLPKYISADPDDDKVVHTALKTAAEWLVSDDAHIVPDPSESIEYEIPGEARIAAARFDYYVDAALGGFDLGQIDASWFWSLLRPLQEWP